MANSTTILILNGPNLNLLGKREPEVYGHMSFEDYLTELQTKFSDITIKYFQSNHEGDLIDAIQAANDLLGVVFNPGGYSHTSIALADAIRSVKVPVIEVHISNIFAREEFRHKSYTAAAAKGSISGLGLLGYQLAIEALIK